MLCRMFGAGGLGALIVEPIENFKITIREISNWLRTKRQVPKSTERRLNARRLRARNAAMAIQMITTVPPIVAPMIVPTSNRGVSFTGVWLLGTEAEVRVLDIVEDFVTEVVDV